MFADICNTRAGTHSHIYLVIYAYVCAYIMHFSIKFFFKCILSLNNSWLICIIKYVYVIYDSQFAKENPMNCHFFFTYIRKCKMTFFLLWQHETKVIFFLYSNAIIMLDTRNILHLSN